IPKPPRITVLFCIACGTQANPKRGLKMALLVSYTLRLELEANVGPPRALNWPTGISAIGAWLYAAAAAAEAEFTAFGSKPSSVRLKRSTSGKSCSQRRPILSVRFGFTRQSSLKNSPRYFAWTVLCELRSSDPELGSPSRNAAISWPNTVVLATTGLLVGLPLKV